MSQPLSHVRPGVAGLSLIELMIAMAIGLVLLLGLVQVMSASRAAYQLSSGVARTQENARFAMDSIQRDLRMAGHLGCVNDQARMQEGMEGIHLKFLADGANHVAAPLPLRFDLGIQGFEAVNTAPGSPGIALPATIEPAGNASLWVPSLPVEIANLEPVANSDIVVIHYFASTGVSLQDSASGFNVTGSNGVTASILPASAGTHVTNDLVVDATALFGIADCAQASVFAGKLSDATTGEVTFSTSGSINQSGFGGVEAYQPSQAVLYRAESIVYYVGVGAGGGPSLYRASANGAGTYVREELVEGLESLQFIYGRDQSGVGTRPTGYISRNAVASDIGGAGAAAQSLPEANDWRRVGMVQVGMLMRSSDPAAADQSVNAPSVLGVSMTPPDGDTFYRSVYESSVALRNRLYGN